MELRIDIGVNQILGLIKQMPQEHKLVLRRELDKAIKKKQVTIKDNDLTDILLSGPVMNEQEKMNFINLKKYFDLWTKTAFA